MTQQENTAFLIFLLGCSSNVTFNKITRRIVTAVVRITLCKTDNEKYPCHPPTQNPM